jgi:hypothetical protein
MSGECICYFPDESWGELNKDCPIHGYSKELQDLLCPKNDTKEARGEGGD